MFDATSRYAAKPTATWTDRQGRPRAHVTLREVPEPPPTGPADIIHRVIDGDRLDRIAWEHLGDPERFWVICDSNRTLDPDDLTRLPGRRIRIPWAGQSA